VHVGVCQTLTRVVFEAQKNTHSPEWKQYKYLQEWWTRKHSVIEVNVMLNGAVFSWL